jgi:hypothetical protein
MTLSRLALTGLLALAACGPQTPNPPTEPAQPIDTPEAAAPPPAPPPGAGTVLPGTGPQSFVGRWAGDVSWCLNTQGAERPIEITTTRFEGYENSCAIDSVDQAGEGYEAALTCMAEGETTRERVRMAVSGQSMRLTWLNRGETTVTLTKCTQLNETPAAR